MNRAYLAIVLSSIGMVTSLAAHGQSRVGDHSDEVKMGERSSVGSLIPTASMSRTRIAHTATELVDGRILVAGGFLEKGSAIGAEIYDSDAGRFLPLPPMLTTRHSHTATLLPDGKVLIAGGYGEGTSPLATTEVFDPKTNSFGATGSLVAARAGHVATLLKNGKVLLAGGVGPNWQFLSSAEIYDPAAGKFSLTGNMTVARESHVAARLLDGRVLVVGGHRDRQENITLYASAETYDPHNGLFTRVGDMGVRRHKHDAVLLSDGRVLVTGGSDERDSRGAYDSSEFFDSRTGMFSAGPRMKLARYKHAGSSLLLPDGRVLISGGAPQAEIYDPQTDAFFLVDGETRLAGHFSATAPLRNGRAFISGGYGNAAEARSTAWLYQP